MRQYFKKYINLNFVFNITSLPMSELYANVIFTKDITRKKKKWEDGTATIKSLNNSPNRFKIVIRDSDGNLVDIVSNKLNSVPNVDDEIKVGNLLVSIESYQNGNDDEKKEKENTPQIIKKVQLRPKQFVALHPRKRLDNLQKTEECVSKNTAANNNFNLNSSKRQIMTNELNDNLTYIECSFALENPRNFDEILSFYLKKDDTLFPNDQIKTNNLNNVQTENVNLNHNLTNSTSEEKEISTPFKSLCIFWGKKLSSVVPNIPISFNSLNEYKDSFLEGISYELNYKIREIYKLYEAGLIYAVSKPPKCSKHGETVFNVRKGSYYFKCKHCDFFKPVQPDISIPSKKDIRSLTKLTKFMHSRGISYHESVLTRKNNIYTLHFLDDKLENVEYSKDDLWVLFSEKTEPFFVVSESYGVSQKNSLEISPFFNNILAELPMQLKITAICLFNVQSEKAAISNLINLTDDLPILPSILNGSKRDFCFPEAKEGFIIKIAQKIALKYHLNEDQTKALLKVSNFFNGNDEPIIFIHGIFGAGKSKLLSIIIIFLDKVLKKFNRNDQILISASTNVAVDNILSNLYEFGFENFTRVGSVKKIKKSILPFVTGHGNEEAISELNSIITETDKDEQKVIREALRNAQSECTTKISKIDKVRVVGVTCAATSFEVMQNKKFTFVLLDECSQQTEPISMLPISFGCSNLICCGDPLQLPPTISKSAPNGYGRPIFSRLSNIYKPIMLSIQYRCHPSISNICNVLFYKNKIKNGVTFEDRLPLHDMPTMCLFDVTCGEEKYLKGSPFNNSEAITVISLVNYLINLGIDNKEIGVIAFYKSQVDLISDGLKNGRKRPIVDVSTVDSFQGDEREIIIITTTKTSKTKFIDFPERINVAISRAKRHLFIISNVRSLIDSENWNNIFSQVCKAPNRRLKIDHPPDLEKWDPFN